MWNQSLPFLLGYGFLFPLLFWPEGENGSFRGFHLAFYIGTAPMCHPKSMVSRTTLGTNCVGSGLGSFETETSSDWSGAGTVELDGPSEPSLLGGRRPGLHIPAFSSLETDSPPGYSSCSQSWEGLWEGVSQTGRQQDEHLGPEAGSDWCNRAATVIWRYLFLKTSALLRCNLHSIKCGGF